MKNGLHPGVVVPGAEFLLERLCQTDEPAGVAGDLDNEVLVLGLFREVDRVPERLEVDDVQIDLEPAPLEERLGEVHDVLRRIFAPVEEAGLQLHLEGAALAALDQVRALAAHPRVRAIGEIGLDYYWVKTPEARAFSRDFFDAQLSLAEELDLPAIVHDRDAHKDCLDIVRSHPNARGVFHCCALSLEDAKVAVDRGWMLSFTGNITFSNARRAPEVVRWVPLDRLMLETDAPYMAPEPHRGERCDSSFLPLTAARVAQLKGLETGEVLRATLENGKRFFNIL